MGSCVEWGGRRNKQRYGCDGRSLAHRVAWERAHGPIPEGMCVLHRCDNPPCVNVDHLWLGTRGDNNLDRARKGRSLKRDMRGENSPRSKLSDSAVDTIRQLCAMRVLPQRAIAQIFRISQTAVGFIHRRRNWSHLK